MKNTGAHEPNANDVLAKMLREEARKRDYGDGRFPSYAFTSKTNFRKRPS